MDALRALAAGAGLTNVETFIASGNLLFDSSSKSAPTLESRIEDALHAGLGYRVAACVRTMPELAAIAAKQPFGGKHPAGSSLYIGFLKAAPDAARRRAVEALADRQNEFVVDGSELYWRLRVRFSETKVTGARLEKALGTEATLRNVTTVQKLAAKV